MSKDLGYGANMTILVTGFDAFGGASVNPSEIVVSAVAQRSLANVVTAVLPTSYCATPADSCICPISTAPASSSTGQSS
jgi:hypothetical protein